MFTFMWQGQRYEIDRSVNDFEGLSVDEQTRRLFGDRMWHQFHAYGMTNRELELVLSGYIEYLADAG